MWSADGEAEACGFAALALGGAARLEAAWRAAAVTSSLGARARRPVAVVVFVVCGVAACGAARVCWTPAGGFGLSSVRRSEFMRGELVMATVALPPLRGLPPFAWLESYSMVSALPVLGCLVLPPWGWATPGICAARVIMAPRMLAR